MFSILFYSGVIYYSINGYTVLLLHYLGQLDNINVYGY